MKKFISIVLLICMCIYICACTTESNKNFDKQIIQTSNTMLEEWGLEEGRTFSVSLDRKDIYHIDINGEELLIKIEEDVNTFIEKTNRKEYSSKVVEMSKKKIINYINDSDILKDKEELVQYINNLTFKTADFPADGDSPPAEYDYKEDVIFINNSFKKYICEWMLVHELVHALCQKTNGGIENERYPFDRFNEVLTDVITASMNPKIKDGISSVYSQYYGWIYLYLGCVGIDGIEAYFYGYDEILSKIPEAELDIFVESVEALGSQMDAIVIICNCINKWGLENMD